MSKHRYPDHGEETLTEHCYPGSVFLHSEPALCVLGSCCLNVILHELAIKGQSQCKALCRTLCVSTSRKCEAHLQPAFTLLLLGDFSLQPDRAHRVESKRWCKVIRLDITSIGMPPAKLFVPPQSRCAYTQEGHRL